MKFIIRWLITAIAVGLAVKLVPGIAISSQSEAWVAVTITALVLGLVNQTVKPLLTVAGCGFVALTMGLGMTVINALCLWLAAWVSGDLLGSGFEVTGFWPAFWGGIVISLVSWLLNIFVTEDEGAK